MSSLLLDLQGPSGAVFIDWDVVTLEGRCGGDLDLHRRGEDLDCHQGQGGEVRKTHGQVDDDVIGAPLKIYICPLCGVPFSDLPVFAAHMEMEHEVVEEREGLEEYSCSSRGTVSSSGSFYTALEVTQEE